MEKTFNMVGIHRLSFKCNIRLLKPFLNDFYLVKEFGSSECELSRVVWEKLLHGEERWVTPLLDRKILNSHRPDGFDFIYKMISATF